MAARGPQNGRRGLERGPILGYGRSRQLSLNKFLDPSTPSMRKVDEEKTPHARANMDEMNIR